LSGRKYNHLFIYPSQIATARLGPNDTIVFIDDFVGTGEQAISAWNDMFQELVADVGRVYLVVVAARQSGRVEVTEKTGLALVNHIELNDSDNVFDASCPAFDQTDKDTILKYCHSCDAKNPKGWGNGGLVVVLAHKCPNNTIPILHVRNEQWMGLFPRYD
jgi:hypothetical protein